MNQIRAYFHEVLCNYPISFMKKKRRGERKKNSYKPDMKFAKL
jgi:hypothetical protein